MKKYELNEMTKTFLVPTGRPPLFLSSAVSLTLYSVLADSIDASSSKITKSGMESSTASIFDSVIVGDTAFCSFFFNRLNKGTSNRANGNISKLVRILV